MKKILVLFIISVFCYGWIANASIFSSEVAYKEVEQTFDKNLFDREGGVRKWKKF